MSKAIKFPSMPSYRAKWAPVYMEPILNSGERITVGIAVVSDSGDIEVTHTLSERPLECAFGSRGISLIESATFCLDSLRQHLESKSSSWTAPLSGVLLGEWQPAAGDNIENIISNVTKLSSSFAVLAEPSVEKGILKRDSEDRWSKLIKQDLESRGSVYVQNLSKQVQIATVGRKTKIDYLGVRYAANFSKLLPNRLTAGVKDSKAKLWDLERLRDMTSTLTISQFGLIAWRPIFDSPEYTENQFNMLEEGVQQLHEEAKKTELETFFATNARQASKHIIEVEGEAA